MFRHIKGSIDCILTKRAFGISQKMHKIVALVNCAYHKIFLYKKTTKDSISAMNIKHLGLFEGVIGDRSRYETQVFTEGQ